MKEQFERTVNIIVGAVAIVLSIVIGKFYGAYVPIMFMVFVYLIFPRQLTNAVVMVLKKKQYVICYLKRMSTNYTDRYFVVPDPDKVTDVGGKGAYTLDEKFAAYKQDENGRLVFILIEGDTTPYQFKNDEEKMNWFKKTRVPYKVVIEFKQRTADDILFQAKAVHNSLNNRVAEYLFSKKKDVYYIILGILVLIALVVLTYTAYVLQQNNALLQYIASRMSEGSIEIK